MMEFSQDTSAGISSFMNMCLLNTFPPQLWLDISSRDVGSRWECNSYGTKSSWLKFEVQEHIRLSASGPEYSGYWSDFIGWHMARYYLVFIKYKGFMTFNIVFKMYNRYAGNTDVTVNSSLYKYFLSKRSLK